MTIVHTISIFLVAAILMMLLYDVSEEWDTFCFWLMTKYYSWKYPELSESEADAEDNPDSE